MLGGDLGRVPERPPGRSTTCSRSSCGRSPAVTIPLVDSSFSYDGAADAVTDGLTFDNYLPNFPYLGLPYSGYDVPSS